MQFCKSMTTIEGSLEPLCRLDHSGTRCRRVTMRSRSLVSASSRALVSCPDVKGEDDTHFVRSSDCTCASFSDIAMMIDGFYL